MTPAETEQLAALAREVLVYAGDGLIRNVDADDIIQGLVTSYGTEVLAVSLLAIMTGLEDAYPGTLPSYVDRLRSAARE